MGRFCTYSSYDNVRQYAKHELGIDSETVKMLEQTVNGNYVFTLIHNLKTDEKTILIDHVRKINGEWGHRGYGESCQPYVYTCSERMLKQSTNQSHGAVKWREECRRQRRIKRLMINLFKNLEVGTIMTSLNGDSLMYLRKYRNSPTQIVCTNLTKNRDFRYSIESFNYESLVGELGLENKLAN